MPDTPPDADRRRILQALAGLFFAGPFLARGADRGSGARRQHLYEWTLPPGDSALVGRAHVSQVREGETLYDVARRFDVGYWDIILANPDVDFWLPGSGRPVVIPRRFILPDTPREGIVVNVPELRLYFYPPAGDDGHQRVITHPIGIGRQDWSTPLGTTSVSEKIVDPAWYPPASIRAEARAEGEPLPGVVPPGPDNPLGAYALILALPGYMIHGTNRPEGVGMRVSHGCIRLYPEDIAALFPQVPRGTPVRLVQQPVKHTWARGRLWVEVHPLPMTDDYTANDLRFSADERRRLEERVTATALARGQLPDRDRLAAVLERPSGIPTPVTD
ncbi:L,D-transpeptidase family protein [Arhodomonas aquaeolei]|uniref:L,D-transpeptidase family protein n=1 Tax=Arhodomonas aquaeolei TaxID=2369 RepID=UPI00036733A6|nr:L,D-transpeptidase family protein [Arhodomonas aquaeolei]